MKAREKCLEDVAMGPPRAKPLALQPLDLSPTSPVWDTAKRYRNSRGYYFLQVYDPFLRKFVSKFEHVLIWERLHGKLVPPNCLIHHRDLDPGNNRSENLMCIPKPLHHELHAKLRKSQKTMGSLAFEIERQRITEDYQIKSDELLDIWSVIDSTQQE